jgi:hypothetical protein
VAEGKKDTIGHVLVRTDNDGFGKGILVGVCGALEGGPGLRFVCSVHTQLVTCERGICWASICKMRN